MEDTIGKQIALFGGTFDPIHIGHIHLAIEMLENHQLDIILFSPAFCSPHKTQDPPKASIVDRMKMVKLAVEDHPKFKVLDFESKKPFPSYTIDTLKYLQTQYTDCSLSLILSEESAQSFSSWRGSEEIASIANILTGGKELPLSNIENSLQTVLKKGFTRIPIFEVSSTEVRNRLKKRLYCSHLLHFEVLQYIERRRLYRP